MYNIMYIKAYYVNYTRQSSKIRSCGIMLIKLVNAFTSKIKYKRGIDMAVTTSSNTIRITADNDTITGTRRICGINYVAGTPTPSAQMKVTNTSGALLWSANSTSSDVYDVDIRLENGVTYHFDLAGTGTEVILYLE